MNKLRKLTISSTECKRLIAQWGGDDDAENVSGLQLVLITASQCRAFAQECERLGKEADISIQRATALISMAQSWETLAEDAARYEAIVKAEAGS
jgi:hypothetical protein